MNKQGTIFIVIGASGSGKTTLFSETKGILGESIHIPVYDTTRPMRKGEVNKKDYNFIFEDEFHKKVDAGNYLSVYQCHGFNYGISRELEKAINNGIDVLMGVSRSLIGTFKNNFKYVKVIFLDVEYAEIINRLKLRNRESDKDEIKRRLENAKEKIEWAKESENVNITLNNITLEETINELVNYMKGASNGKCK